MTHADDGAAQIVHLRPAPQVEVVDDAGKEVVGKFVEAGVDARLGVHRNRHAVGTPHGEHLCHGLSL